VAAAVGGVDLVEHALRGIIRQDTVTEAVEGHQRPRHEEFRAVSDVSTVSDEIGCDRHSYRHRRSVDDGWG
jgi:hypothetical protein